MAKLTPAQKAKNYYTNLDAWTKAGDAGKLKKGYESVYNPDGSLKAGSSTPTTPQYDPYTTPSYQKMQSDAEKRYTTATAQSSFNDNQQALDYGATTTADQYGNLKANFDWSTLDVTNPFSKAALLQRSYNQTKDRDTNSYASRGMLYSGALLNQRGNSQFGFEQNQDALQKSLRDILMQGNQTRENAKLDRDETGTAAFINAIQNAPQP